MSFIIAVVAISNLALGYLLALYLGKAQAPWAMNATVRQDAEPRAPIKESVTSKAEADAETAAEPEAEAPAGDVSLADTQPLAAPAATTSAGRPEQSVTTSAERRPRNEEPLDEEAALAGAEALRSELAKLRPAPSAHEAV